MSVSMTEREREMKDERQAGHIDRGWNMREVDLERRTVGHGEE